MCPSGNVHFDSAVNFETHRLLILSPIILFGMQTPSIMMPDYVYFMVDEQSLMRSSCPG